MESQDGFWEVDNVEKKLWLNKSCHPIMGDPNSRRRKAIVEVLDSYNGVIATAEDILDIGSGGGLEFYFPPDLLASKRITAIDCSQKILDANTANKKVLADASERLPLSSGTFDVVTQFFVNRYLRDQRRNMGEIVRLLKPTGRALIIDHEFLFNPLEVRTFEPFEIRALAVLEGCKDVQVEELFPPTTVTILSDNPLHMSREQYLRGGLYFVSFTKA